MTPKNRNRLIAVCALAVAGTGLSLVAFGNLGENLVYYWTPGELLAQEEKAAGATVRLGGIVKPGTVEWAEDRNELTFVVADDHGEGAAAVTVHSTHIPPQMFRDGIGVVVEGHYTASKIFETDRLMVNHSNEYRAPEEGESYEGGSYEGWKETVGTGAPASEPTASASGADGS